MRERSSSKPRRILAAWLPRWSTDHLKKTQPSLKSAGAPIVLYEKVQSALRIRAMDEVAARAGFYPGQALADARAIEPKLIAVEADPENEDRAFRRLAEGLMRYSPIVAIQATGEVFIEITGCQRLFGGEEAILDDLQARVNHIGYAVRVAIADSAGAAWGLARFGDGGLAPAGSGRSAIARLPVEALRLPNPLSDRLRRLGLKSVGQLYDMPRGALTARFSKLLLQRLGQALGEEPEPLTPIVPAAQFYAEKMLAEPISSVDAVNACLEPLAETLADQLAKAAAGGRRFELALFRVDNEVMRVEIRASAPARDAAHLKRLFADRLDDIQKDCDAGFGFELLRLGAFDVAPLAIRQRAAFDTHPDYLANGQALAELKDRLSNRLGARNVCRIGFRNTHLPERAAFFAAVLKPAEKQAIAPAGAERPVKLLPRPEEIEAIAEVPDGPPVRFTWRRVRYAVAKAGGPERIADEWQRTESPTPTRDYYRVETPEGRRYWLFREGLYGRETARPKWFLHGFLP